MSEQPVRLYTLDAIRGLAILLIMLFHATEISNLNLNQPFLLNSFKFADAGVATFFVLSGFTLTWVYAPNFGKGISWRSYMLKRCLRICPFYWLITLAVLPVYFLLPTFGKGNETETGHILKSLLLVPQSQSPILSVAWFLSYILLFYALFGLSLSLKPKFSIPILGTWLALSVIFNIGRYAAGLDQGNGSYFWLSFLLSLYGIEFAAGGLMAFWLVRHRTPKVWRYTLVNYGLLAFVVFALIDDYVFLGTNSFAMRGYEVLTYGVASVCLIGGIAASECAAGDPGRLRAPVSWLLKFVPSWLGPASYAIYLTHYLFLSIGVKLLHSLKLNSIGLNVGLLLCCLAAILLGRLIHRYIERPCNAAAHSIVMRLPINASTSKS